jgi:acetolactate synthase-1/2/3 large subunit
MLTSMATVDDTVRHQPVQAAPTTEQITQLRARLIAAERPLVLLGGSGWDHASCNAIQRFVERNQLPVACVFRRQDLFDNAHPNYIGDVGIGINPALAKRIKDADLILTIGARLGEMTTGGYQLLQAPRPHQQLIHVHADAQELGRVYQADMMINSGMSPIAFALEAMSPLNRPAAQQGTDQVAQARAAYLAWQAEPALFADTSIALNLWSVMQTLRDTLPRDTILTNGAGNFASWGHRFWQYGHRDAALRTQLAPTSGAMGYGVPAGIAAALLGAQQGQAQPVVTLTGDGDFMMNGQELATAVQYGARVLFIVFNNRMFGTIRMHQERNYPARVSGTELHNPDFAALARAYGAFGESVDETDAFAAVLQRALTHLRDQAGPALIELRYDGNLITPSAT